MVMRDFEYTFPCPHCGECQNWLAYNVGDINDITLIENCIQSKCSIFGKEVNNVKSYM